MRLCREQVNSVWDERALGGVLQACKGHHPMGMSRSSNDITFLQPSVYAYVCIYLSVYFMALWQMLFYTIRVAKVMVGHLGVWPQSSWTLFCRSWNKSWNRHRTQIFFSWQKDVPKLLPMTEIVLATPILNTCNRGETEIESRSSSGSEFSQSPSPDTEASGHPRVYTCNRGGTEVI